MMTEKATIEDGMEGTGDVVEKDWLLLNTFQGIGFFITVVLLYFIFWWIFDPSHVSEGPSLLLVLVLLMVLCFLLTIISAFFDVLRVIVFFVIIVGVFSFYFLFDIDHYYRVEQVSKRTNQTEPVRLTPKQVYQRWRKDHPVHKYPAMVLVTSSGGGITAARWTTEVLTRLQAAIPKFGDSLVMISTVSGGSVGGMYFIDAYAHGMSPKEAERLGFKRISSADKTKVNDFRSVSVLADRIENLMMGVFPSEENFLERKF